MTHNSNDPRLKRLRLRSWRRGTKEMDLLLGHFADLHLAGLTTDELDAFEALLEENDQDLYAWASGRETMPVRHADLVGRIVSHAHSRFVREGDVL